MKHCEAFLYQVQSNEPGWMSLIEINHCVPILTETKCI